MSTAQVYAKTGKAVEEIQTKKYKLKPKVRNLLFLIDGTKPVDSVTEMSRQLGMSNSELADLESGGFIVKSGRRGRWGSGVAGATRCASRCRATRPASSAWRKST